MSGIEEDWRSLNRKFWDERVAVHLGPGGYALDDLRAGRGRMNAIEEAELGDVSGQRVVHLQCHFGRDSLCLLQRGAASVVGLDFSPPAIAAADRLAAELGLAGRARFVCADLYDARQAIGTVDAAGFDLAYVTWGAICWLPDIGEWARIVAHFLRPGGSLYLAEGHPAAYVFDDAAKLPDGRPGFFAPYFQKEAVVMDDATDYVNATARLANTRNHSFMHPLSGVIGALLEAGLRLEWLHEHDAVTWRMFGCLVEGADGLFRWPDKPWLPLSYSMRATKA